MAKVTGTVESPLDAVATFARVSDFARIDEWDPGIVESELLTEGAEPEIGSRYRVVADFMGRRSELEYVVTEFTPGERIVLRGENRTVVAVDEITVAPTASGSRVRWSADLSLKGPLRLADPLLGVAFDRVGRKAMESLTSWLSV